MKSQGSTKFEINLVKTLSPERKKLLMLAPLGIVLFITVIYFATYDGSASENPNPNANVDFTLPTGDDSKLNSDKRVVFDEFEQLKKQESKDKKNDFENVLDDPLGKKGVENKLSAEEEQLSLVRQQLQMMNSNKKEAAPANNQNSKKRAYTGTGGSTSKNSYSTNSSDKNWDDQVDKEFDDFFSSEPESKSSESSSQTDSFIYAVIHGNQNIKQGERVKLRLTKNATIAGTLYKRNSYIFAFPSFNENRILLDINQVNHVPVNISAYDAEDSSLGLYVKGAGIGGEIVDEGQKDAIDEVNVNGVSIGSTIKNAFRKRQNIERVTLLNNTKLILKPNN